MSARLTLVSASSTAATNTAGFAADEPLDARGGSWAAQARGRITRAARVQCSPAQACRQTAAALDFEERDGLVIGGEPLLCDWDMGRWRGRTLDDVAAGEPDAIGSWLTDPDASPHGGETLTDLLARVAHWLREVPEDGHTVAITHAAVIRAAIIVTVSGAPEGFWRIDIAPLTATVLRGRSPRWTLRTTGRPLIPRRDPDAPSDAADL